MTRTMSAQYDGEEIQCQFTATAVLDSYGVPGSPTWYTPEDVEIAGKVCILGVDWDPAELPAALVFSILEQAAECEFTVDWPQQEEMG